MEEITGPVLAITLVLSSVFIPCCFLGGITGQFFRQFAVTIAVSTIISAINALTMTPSRAVLIFKTEEGATAHEPQARGAALVDLRRPGRRAHGLARPELLAGHWACPAAAARRRAERRRLAVLGHRRVATSSPALLAGGVVGWFIIRPVNAVLGWFFRGFNRCFDRMTGVYGRIGRRRAAAERDRAGRSTAACWR